jgi:hypothetical protein
MQELSTKDDHNGDQGDFSIELTYEQIQVTFFADLNRSGRVSKLSFQSYCNTPLRAVFYGLCTILRNSDLERVLSLSERELDSFLRDENHIPCMKEGLSIDFVQEFSSKFLASFLNNELKDEVEDWSVESSASYVEKIGAINDFLAIKVNTLDYFSNANLEMHLVHLSEETIFCEFRSSINRVKQAPNVINEDSRASLGKLMGRIIDNESIKLVVE